MAHLLFLFFFANAHVIKRKLKIAKENLVRTVDNVFIKQFLNATKSTGNIKVVSIFSYVQKKLKKLKHYK